MKHDKIIKVLGMIEADMESDVEKFEGAPFNGRTVAEYFGYQGAAIAALAGIVKKVVETLKEAPR